MCLHVWCLEEIQELLDKRWQVVCTTVVATVQLVEVTFMYVTVYVCQILRKYKDNPPCVC